MRLRLAARRQMIGGELSLYRVTLKINFMVDINEANQRADLRPPLQGDTPEAAVNRVSCVWLKGMGLARKTRKSLGVGRTFHRKADVEVVRCGPAADTDGTTDGAE